MFTRFLVSVMSFSIPPYSIPWLLFSWFGSHLWKGTTPTIFEIGYIFSIKKIHHETRSHTIAIFSCINELATGQSQAAGINLSIPTSGLQPRRKGEPDWSLSVHIFNSPHYLSYFPQIRIQNSNQTLEALSTIHTKIKMSKKNLTTDISWFDMNTLMFSLISGSWT